VLNAYTLTFAMLLITAGRLGDRFGQRNLFAIGLGVFTIASAACGLSQDPFQLIFARVVQGVGGALLTPQTLAILAAIFPSDRRGAAFGVWGGIAGVATIAGPVLGGVITTYLDWRWIFFVNVPIGVVAFVLAFVVIPDLRPGRSARIDPVGVLLASGGLLALTFGLIEGERFSWGTITTIAGVPVTIPGILAASVVLLVLFFLWDARQPNPLVPLSLFRDRNFSVTNWVGTTVAFGMVGIFLPLTIYLQSALGFTPLKAGLTLLPMSLVSMPVAPIAGRLADRMGGKYILMTGLFLFAAGMSWVDWAARIDSTWLSFLPGLILAGLGLGCTFAPLATVAMRNVTPEMAGAASGVLNTTRQLGAALSSAVIGAVLQNRLAASLHDEAVRRSAELPPPARQPFIDSFSNVARGGLEVGRSTSSAAAAHAGGLPPQVAAQVSRVAHEVFAYGFINAMRPTLAVPVAVLVLGALSCLAIKRRRPPQEQANEEAARRPLEAQPIAH
jgi:EmrB/QacA subfamily drug resistance transporter